MIDELREKLLLVADAIKPFPAFEGMGETIREAAALLAAAPQQGDAEDGYKPIERDESMGREYIPMPGGWEVQTQGSGSTFRIAGPERDDLTRQLAEARA